MAITQAFGGLFREEVAELRHLFLTSDWNQAVNLQQREMDGIPCT
jgi:hypothetical protein